MTRQTGAWLRFLVIVALLAGTALFLHSRAQADILPPRKALSSFPLHLGNWQGAVVTIPQWALDILGTGEFVERSFSRSPDEPSVDLFIAYFPSQRTGNTLHSPQNCLPGSGWTPVAFARVELTRLGAGPIKVNRYVLAKGLERMMVLYWYEEHGRAVASEYWAKFYLVADAMRMNRSDGALVRVTTPIATNESLDSAERRGVTFIDSVLPILGRYVPE